MASELALIAGIAAPTASGHLSQLLAGGLVTVKKQGRHRYYRLSCDEVATVIEALMDFAQHSRQLPKRHGLQDTEMRKARVCYDHLAGACGVELFARLTTRKLIALEDGAIGMTAQGEREFNAFGINVEALKAARRPICRTCLDWSEQRTHLAGGLGAALLERFFELKWIRRVECGRAVRFTCPGETAFTKLFLRN